MHWSTGVKWMLELQMVKLASSEICFTSSAHSWLGLTFSAFCAKIFKKKCSYFEQWNLEKVSLLQNWDWRINQKIKKIIMFGSCTWIISICWMNDYLQLRKHHIYAWNKWSSCVCRTWFRVTLEAYIYEQLVIK